MRKKHLFCATLLLVALITILLPGCGTRKTATKSTSPPATKPTTPSSGQTQTNPRPAEEQIVYDYYKAINDKRYQDAFAMTSDRFKSSYASFAAFEASYRDYVQSVKVVSLRRLDQFSTPQRIEFDATYDAAYIKPYPAGSGQLPPVNVVVPDAVNPNHWLLDGIGTGP
jgi:hypothetical protein